MGKDKVGRYSHAYGFEWGLYENESLVLLILLTHRQKLYTDEELKTVMNRLNKEDFHEILSKIQQNEEANKLLLESLQAIEKKEIKWFGGANNLESDPEQLKVNLLSYSTWANEKEVKIAYYISEIAKNIHNDKLIVNCKDNQLSKAKIEKLLHEPLWLLSTAILYLHGCDSLKSSALGYSNKELDYKTVYFHKDFYQIYSYANDAAEIKKLLLCGDYSEGKKVKPHDFIEWSRSLNINFPIYSLLPNNNEKDKVTSLETNKELSCNYTSPYIDLMLKCIAENGINDSMQSKHEILKDWFLDNPPEGVSISHSMAKSMATLVRLPSSAKGGNKKTV